MTVWGLADVLGRHAHRRALHVPVPDARRSWQLGAGLALARDGTEAAQDAPNPSHFESSDFVFDYLGALAELSKTSGHVRCRLFAGGGKIHSSLGTHGWFVAAGGGLDLQACRSTCLGLGIAASEQFLDYRDNGGATVNGGAFHAQFPALVVHASGYITMPVADFSLAFRFGPRAKWIQDDDHDNEDDPQPGLGAELVLSRSL